MKKHVLSGLFLAIAIGVSAAGWPQVNLSQKSGSGSISSVINALVYKNDTLFAATADGIWASPSGVGGDWIAFGLQGQEVKLLNFKVQKLAIVATAGNIRPLYQLTGGAWVQNTALPDNVAITGGVNFEQKWYSDTNTLSIVIPRGSTTLGDIYKSLDGGATFAKVTVGKTSTGVNAFDNDDLFYFPNSNKDAANAEANNNQTSFFRSIDKGNTYARFANTYSVATGVPANFIFKLISAQNPGHTYYFLGGQKDVVRVDSLGMTNSGTVIPWNNPENMACFITNRTVAITDGTTNLTTFPTHNFNQMLQTTNGKLYLLTNRVLYVTHNEGATYTPVMSVTSDTILTSVVAKGMKLFVGTTHGVKFIDVDNTSTFVKDVAVPSNISVYTNSEGVHVEAEGKYAVTVYNMYGQVISKTTNIEGKNTIQMPAVYRICIFKVDAFMKSKAVKVLNPK